MIPYCRSSSPDTKALQKYIHQIESTGILTNNGPLSRELESRIELYSGRSCVSVSSGTIGLYLSLLSVGDLEKGEEVIIPSFNFASGVQAINLAGMRPLFVEIENDYSMSLDHLRELLKANKKCRFVIAVNYYGWAGNPAEIEDLVRKIEIEDSREIYLIFDSAHAFGASYQNRPIGSFGDFEVFSFSATKVIGGSEGGAATCSNDLYLERFEIAKNYGTDNYKVVSAGINGKLSEPNAAYILAKMDFMEAIIAKRSNLANYYISKLKQIDNISPPSPRPQWTPVFKDIVLQIPFTKECSRESVRKKLKDDGIDTRIYFWPPLHTSTVNRDWNVSLPYTEQIANRVLALPFYDNLTEPKIDWISDRLRYILKDIS